MTNLQTTSFFHPGREQTGPHPVPQALSKAVRMACAINGGDAHDREMATSTQGATIRSLCDIDSEALRQSLAAQLVVLDALFLSLTADAMRAKTADDRVKLAKAALQAQGHYKSASKTLASLCRRPGASLVLEEEW